MADHIVHVATSMIPGRNALYAAECEDCNWRSREYRDFERACKEADKHATSLHPAAVPASELSGGGER